MLLVTGGAGFIGTNFVRDWLAQSTEPVINLDKLTYAANPHNLLSVADDRNHTLIQGDIADTGLVKAILERHQPRAIVHMAAETHVDRSIEGPAAFVQTNVVGTSQLLEVAYRYWKTLGVNERAAFRFLQVSTDEVYGSLSPDEPAFTEQTPYAPNSPYAASKAASDHLVRAYYRTYGFPVVTVHSSNNYGPFQYPEKFIPLLVTRALDGLPLPIYGDGQQIRDWMYVADHCAALRLVLEKGRIGETYNIGGGNEIANLALAEMICDVLDEIAPLPGGRRYRDQITHVQDRAGHDRRYAVDTYKICTELGWSPSENFQEGLRKTVMWYVENHRRTAAVTPELK